MYSHVRFTHAIFFFFPDCVDKAINRFYLFIQISLFHNDIAYWTKSLTLIDSDMFKADDSGQ